MASSSADDRVARGRMQRMFGKADLNKDGRVDFNEFIIMRKKTERHLRKEEERKMRHQAKHQERRGSNKGGGGGGNSSKASPSRRSSRISTSLSTCGRRR